MNYDKIIEHLKNAFPKPTELTKLNKNEIDKQIDLKERLVS